MAKKKKAKSLRGGPRPGAGRKKKGETVVMRIPAEILPKVSQLIEQHRKKIAG